MVKFISLETLLALFAGYVLDAKLIKQILRWEMEIVKESPLIRELYQLGFEEGERKATVKGLHQILSVRFETAFGAFEERFEQLDLASLEHLHEVALTVQTLAAFEEALAEMLSNSQADPDRSESDIP